VGAWYLIIGASLLLILIGLYTHWTIFLLGAVLPFMPLVFFLYKRSRRESGRARLGPLSGPSRASVKAAKTWYGYVGRRG